MNINVTCQKSEIEHSIMLQIASGCNSMHFQFWVFFDSSLVYNLSIKFCNMIFMAIFDILLEIKSSSTSDRNVPFPGLIVSWMAASQEHIKDRQPTFSDIRKIYLHSHFQVVVYHENIRAMFFLMKTLFRLHAPLFWEGVFSETPPHMIIHYLNNL